MSACITNYKVLLSKELQMKDLRPLWVPYFKDQPLFLGNNERSLKTTHLHAYQMLTNSFSFLRYPRKKILGDDSFISLLRLFNRNNSAYVTSYKTFFSKELQIKDLRPLWIPHFRGHSLFSVIKRKVM